MATCRQVYSHSVAPGAPERLPLIFKATEVKSTGRSPLALSAHHVLVYISHVAIQHGALYLTCIREIEKETFIRQHTRTKIEKKITMITLGNMCLEAPLHSGFK